MKPPNSNIKIFPYLESGRKINLQLIFIYLMIVPLIVQAQLWQSGNGSSGGEVYKSKITGRELSRSMNTENGWEQIFDGMGKHRIYDIKIAPSNPSVIYAAGSGVYRSTDRGVSWDSIGVYLEMIGVDPLNSEVVFGASSTPVEISNIYRTTTGGDKWDNLSIHSSTSIPFFVFDRSEPEAVYTALFNKLIRSFDYGTKWEDVNFQDTIPGGNRIYSLAIPNDDPNLLYLSSVYGVYKSGDRGETWDTLNIATDENYNELFLDPVNSQTIYVIIRNKGIFKSIDCGEKWIEKNNGLTNLYFSNVSLVINPKNMEEIFLAADSSLYLSINGGDSWNIIEPSPPSQIIYSIAIDTSSGTRILIGGSLRVIYALDLVTSVKEDMHQPLPRTIELHQNYPNPFNPSTVIEFNLTHSQNVVLEIFDLLGRSVKRLLHSHLKTGVYSIVWDGTSAKGNEIPSGVYIYRLTAGTHSKSKKMILIH